MDIRESKKPHVQAKWKWLNNIDKNIIETTVWIWEYYYNTVSQKTFLNEESYKTHK